MTIINKIYSWLHQKFSCSGQRGAYSAGFWQEKTRRESLILCKDIRGRVLEVGCGEGLFLVQLGRQNPQLEIWGVDNHSQRLNQAEKRIKAAGLRNVNLSAQDAANLSFDAEYFDAVICINVIFNLGSLDLVKQVLGQMKWVCKKSGRVIMDLRNSGNPLLRAKYKLARFYDRTVRILPLNTYSLKQFQSLLRDLGLDIVNRRFIGFPIKRFAPIIIIEAQKSLLRRKNHY